MTTPRTLRRLSRAALLASIPILALVFSTGDADARSRHGHHHAHHASCARPVYRAYPVVVRRPAYYVRPAYVPVPVYADPYAYAPGPYAPVVYDPYYVRPSGFVAIGGRHVQVGIAF